MAVYRSVADFMIEVRKVADDDEAMAEFLQDVCQEAGIEYKLTITETLVLNSNDGTLKRTSEGSYERPLAKSRVEGHLENALVMIYLSGKYYEVCENVLSARKQKWEADKQRWEKAP